MKKFETPSNLVELLNGVVGAASRTAFYSAGISLPYGVASLDAFAGIPVTPLAEYRKQRLADVLADASAVQWVAGAYRGQRPDSVAVAEGPDEAANRFDILIDAVRGCLPQERVRTCAVVTSPERRFFAAEVATILIHFGFPTHVFLDKGGVRTYERLSIVSPNILVMLSDGLRESELSREIELCVTFRRSHRLETFRQLDMYLVDEFGFLGQSTDCEKYVLNKDVYYFEGSDDGGLVVTALHNKVQPLLRVGLPDRARFVDGDSVELVELSL